MKTSYEELKKVSYLDLSEIGERLIPLQPCYHEDKGWESWVMTEIGLVPIQIHGIVNACYFSKKPIDDKDVYIGFINLILKHANFKELSHFERGIYEDINNLSASVEKINLLHNIWLDNNELISQRFITTEIEYIIKVCRSLFDLLQEVVSKIWNRFQYIDENIKKKQLKSTFSKMVLLDNKLTTSEQIQERFSIPKQLADFYHRNGSFFYWLRSYRDKISHSGENIDILYITDEGFAIPTDKEPFSNLHVWEVSKLKGNNLGSVRTFVAYIILNTLHALEDFSKTISQIMKFPKDMAPEHNVYVRGEHTHILKELHTYAEGNEWIKT